MLITLQNVKFVVFQGISPIVPCMINFYFCSYFSNMVMNTENMVNVGYVVNKFEICFGPKWEVLGRLVWVLGIEF